MMQVMVLIFFSFILIYSIIFVFLCYPRQHGNDLYVEIFEPFFFLRFLGQGGNTHTISLNISAKMKNYQNHAGAKIFSFFPTQCDLFHERTKLILGKFQGHSSA